MKERQTRFIVLFIPLLCILGMLPQSGMIAYSLYSSQETTRASHTLNPLWYQNAQVYNMMAFPPEDINRYYITVNGLWNGFFAENLSSPFALGRFIESFYSGREYHSDEEFVSAQHQQGMIVPGTILTTQGHASLQGERLEEFACRSVDGRLCYWDMDAESYWMNANNPDFINWCIEHGKKAIDANADMIVLDEIQGNSLVPMFQWASQYLGVPAPGFSNHTIQRFRSYLEDTYSPGELHILFDIEDIDIYDLRSRIAETIDLPYDERIATDSFIDVYITFLDESNFLAKKRIIKELRSYTQQVGKDIVIGANSYALGTNRPGGFWPKGLHFADLVDVFTFENAYTTFFDNPLPGFPRNKWLAWEKLAHAATNAPAVILIDTSTFEAIYTRLIPLRGFSNYLSILCAEAYANQGSFVNYYFRPLNKAWNWRGCKTIYEFVLDHREFYEKPSSIPTDLVILYLYGEGMRKKSDTYLGCAQALAESHIPFDVIFDGDGQYINETLQLANLSKYSVAVIPSVVQITDKQEMLIKEYVESGGIAVVFDPQELGFISVEGEVPYGNGLFYFLVEDKGALYFQTYDYTYQNQFVEIVQSYVEDVIHIKNTNRKIVVTPYYQEEEKRLVIHLVNYDHIGILDLIWPKCFIHVRIKKPVFDVDNVYMISPDFPGEKNLDWKTNGDFIEFTVPYLRVYNLVIIEGKQLLKNHE